MKIVRFIIAILLLAAAVLATVSPVEPGAPEQTINQAAAQETTIEPEAVQAFAQVKETAAPTPTPTQTEPPYVAELRAKAILAEPTPIPEPTPEPIEFTQAEKKLIARVVYAESRGEIFDGQVAVAQVVINRYLSGTFGKTVKRVVFAKHQFAVSSKYNDENMRAVETAIAEMPYPKTMFFFQVSKRKHWRNFIYYRRIGNHSFYLAGK